MQFEKIVSAEDQGVLIKIKDALRAKGFAISKENINSFYASRGSSFSNLYSPDILKYLTVLNVKFDAADKKIIFSYNINTGGCIVIPKDQQKLDQELQDILSNISGVGKIQILNNANSSSKPNLMDLYQPKSSFQWLALIVLIIGIFTGGAIGGCVGAVVAIKIYKLDKSENSNSRKIFLSGLYILLGVIAYVLLTVLILSAIPE